MFCLFLCLWSSSRQHTRLFFNQFQLLRFANNERLFAVMAAFVSGLFRALCRVLGVRCGRIESRATFELALNGHWGRVAAWRPLIHRKRIFIAGIPNKRSDSCPDRCTAAIQWTANNASLATRARIKVAQKEIHQNYTSSTLLTNTHIVDCSQLDYFNL